MVIAIAVELPLWKGPRATANVEHWRYNGDSGDRLSTSTGSNCGGAGNIEDGGIYFTLVRIVASNTSLAANHGGSSQRPTSSSVDVRAANERDSLEARKGQLEAANEIGGSESQSQ